MLLVCRWLHIRMFANARLFFDVWFFTLCIFNEDSWLILGHSFIKYPYLPLQHPGNLQLAMQSKKLKIVLRRVKTAH